MPAEIEPGRPFPYRRELAELALAMARELQVLQGGGRHRFLDDSESRIYAAVFAAAPDCPDEVAAWALEMAQRRPWNADVLTKMAENRRKQRAEHEQRQATDENIEKRVQRKEKVPTFGPSVRPLAAVAAGPERRVERHFRERCMQSATLVPLMRVRPEAAAEILLATTIEESPEERYDRSFSLEKEYGLEFGYTCHPTMYWQSPFLSFLQVKL